MRVGLFDFGWVTPGRPPAEALFETAELAVQADGLGYSRYWLAEHHEPEVSHASPEMLLPVLAGMTDRIRVGAAGILLRLQNPLKVAKNFRVLEGLFRKRIDLGLAAGTAPAKTEQALLAGLPHEDDYLARVASVLRHLRDDGDVPLTPLGAGSPEVWILGAGGAASACAAGEHGVSYGMSLFHSTSRDDPAVIRRYLDRFRPSKDLTSPRWNVTVGGFCRERESEARRLVDAHSSAFVVPRVAGTPAQCVEQLAAIAERYDADEVIWLELSRDAEARRRSHALLAEAAALRLVSGEGG